MRGAARLMSRRGFLQNAALAVAAGLTATGCDVVLAPDPRSLADTLSGFLNRPDLARGIGRRYLQQTGDLEAASLESAVRSLMQRLDIDINKTLYLSVPRLQDTMARRVREDFATEEVAVIDGWLLATTELQLCAVVYVDEA